MDFETLSDRFERCQSPEELESRQESRERSERPRATLGRMDSAAEDEARLKGERMQLHFQEIEKAVAEKKTRAGSRVGHRTPGSIQSLGKLAA